MSRRTLPIPTERKCRNCFKVKPISEFYTKTWKGRTTYAYHCKGDCHNEVFRNWARQKRERATKARWDQVYRRTP